VSSAEPITAGMGLYTLAALTGSPWMYACAGGLIGAGIGGALLTDGDTRARVSRFLGSCLMGPVLTLMAFAMLQKHVEGYALMGSSMVISLAVWPIVKAFNQRENHLAKQLVRRVSISIDRENTEEKDQ